jgi:hypothetical protein
LISGGGCGSLRRVPDELAVGDTGIDPQMLAGLLERYDQAVRTGITHNRLRDWHNGNHPGHALGCWLRDYREQVLLFTRGLTVDWTSNVSERGAKAAKQVQARSSDDRFDSLPLPVVDFQPAAH